MKTIVVTSWSDEDYSCDLIKATAVTCWSDEDYEAGAVVWFQPVSRHISVEKDGGAASLVLPVAYRLISGSSPGARFTAGCRFPAGCLLWCRSVPSLFPQIWVHIKHVYCGVGDMDGRTRGPARCVSPPCCVNPVSLCELSPLSRCCSAYLWSRVGGETTEGGGQLPETSVDIWRQGPAPLWRGLAHVKQVCGHVWQSW